MTVPGSANPLLLASAADGGGYEIERSLRFNISDSAFCGRSFSSAGNQKTWSWSAWVKKCNVSTQQSIWSAGSTGTNRSNILFQGTGEIRFFNYAGSVNADLITTPVFRDPSAWYHILAVADTTQATASNRFKLYVNGTQITTFTTASYPSQNLDLVINSAITHGIGRGEQSGGEYFDGYLADIYFIDGQALTPSSFGEFDTNGVWQPKAYTGSYGTNGFRLDFADNSSNTATTLGKDTSGNGNNWTPNNLSVTTTTTTTVCGEVPENSSLTLTAPAGSTFTSVTFASYGNPSGSCPSFTQGTCHAANSKSIVESYLLGNSTATIPATNAIFTDPCSGTAKKLAVVAVATSTAGAGNDSLVDSPTNYGTDDGLGGSVRGNYATLNPLVAGGGTIGNGNLDYAGPGAGSTGAPRLATFGLPASGKWYWEIVVTVASASPGNNSFAFGLSTDTEISTNPVSTATSTRWALRADFSVNTVIGVAYDAATGNLWLASNNSWTSGSPSAGTSPAYTASASSVLFPYFWLRDNSIIAINFGQRPFAYTAPSGFKALCTTNLPTPTIANGATAMDVKLYTGNGSTQTISGLNFSPDLVWIKNRSFTGLWHSLFDTIRGNVGLFANDTTAEVAGYLGGFTSDGFSVTVSPNNTINKSSDAHVAWCWDAGSSTVTNTQGSITSQVRANASVGFSIVTYTGTATTGSQTPTVGHGLNVAPKLVITKRRDGTSDWVVQTDLIPQNYLLYLNSTAAQASIGGSGVSNIPLPTISVFTAAYITGLGVSGHTHVAYCFAPVAGYGNGLSYVGNGSTDGPFCYLGFSPKLILIKCSSTTGNWVLLDTEREGYNVDNDPLFPNLANAEGTTDLLDITSNGFKIRSTDADVNASAATYIVYAWASNPFQYSRAR